MHVDRGEGWWRFIFTNLYVAFADHIRLVFCNRSGPNGPTITLSIASLPVDSCYRSPSLNTRLCHEIMIHNALHTHGSELRVLRYRRSTD